MRELLALLKLFKVKGVKSIRQIAEEIGMNPSSGYAYRTRFFQQLIDEGILEEVDTGIVMWKTYRVNKNVLEKKLKENEVIKLFLEVQTMWGGL